MLGFGKKRDLSGKVVAISGAARGIGLATAKAAIHCGAKVCIGDIDLAAAQQAAQTIGAHAAHIDVRSAAGFAAFIAETERALGPVDILINNAGIMAMGAFLEESQERSDLQIDINLRGVIHGMKAVLPGMLQRGGGHVVNVASLAGRFGIPGAVVYSGTKFAVVGLTEAADAEYRGSGVEFTVVMPSKVRTDLAAGTDEAEGRVIPAVDAEDVAASIIAALQQPQLHVTVPAFLGTAVALQAVAPQQVLSLVRQSFDDRRILTHIDHQQRASYDQRMNAMIPTGTAAKKPAAKKSAKKIKEI